MLPNVIKSFIHKKSLAKKNICDWQSGTTLFENYLKCRITASGFQKLVKIVLCLFLILLIFCPLNMLTKLAAHATFSVIFKHHEVASIILVEAKNQYVHSTFTSNLILIFFLKHVYIP